MTNVASPERSEFLSFLPDERLTAEQFRAVLASGPPARRAWALSQLLRYAPWDEIWTFVSRDEVVAALPALDLPAELAAKWARVLTAEAAVRV